MATPGPIADEIARQLNLHEPELTAIGAKMISAIFASWQSDMQGLSETLEGWIADANIIDTEKVNAYLGTGGAMVIDDNTLILPPESEV